MKRILAGAALILALSMGLTGMSGGLPAEAAVMPLAGSPVSIKPVQSGAGWDHPDLTYRIENCPASMACWPAHTIIRGAFADWDEVSGLTLAEVTGEADIVVRWATGTFIEGYSFDGPGGYLAFGVLPTGTRGEFNGDIFFDDAENWVAAPTGAGYPAEITLYSAAVHEIGHALGLRHSGHRSSVMYPRYRETLDGLGTADIEAIQSLYGLP